MVFGLAEMRVVTILLETCVQLTDLILVLFTMKPTRVVVFRRRRRR